MSQDAVLAGSWGHSFEEDAPGVRVYRRPGPGFDFPRARGRGALELNEDGTWVELGPGAADVPTPAARGRWTTSADGLVLESQDGRRRRAVTTSGRALTDGGPDRLELRETPAGEAAGAATGSAATESAASDPGPDPDPDPDAGEGAGDGAAHVACSRGAGHGRRGTPVDAVALRSAAVSTGRAAGGRADDAVVQALLDRLDVDRVLADVDHLAGLGTRHSTSAGFASAAGWAVTRLEGLGATTTRQPVPVGTGAAQNVVADWPATAGTARQGTGPVVLLVAHLDSVNTAGGPSAPAPGADDNASGAATVLELARLLAPATRRNALRVVLFGGEEQGLLGSRLYVAGLDAAQRARLRAVLNLDMVASRNVEPPGVLVEGAAHARGLVDDVVAAAARWSGLGVSTSLSPFASDHVPFLDAGLPAVLTIEAEDGANDRVHTERDVVARLDREVLTGIARTDLAAAAGWLEVTAAAGPARPPVAGPVVVVRTTG